MLQRTINTAQYLAKDPVAHAKIGQTPHAIIHRDGAACVRYFAPEKATRNALFISMPLINTWTIWDLLPELSLVRALLAAGVPVYLLDWGDPGPEAEDKPISYFIDGVLGRAFDRSLRHAARHHGTDKLDALGYCVGGTFLAVHLARHPENARKMALVAAPIDFHQSGRLHLWAQPDNFPVDAAIDAHGNYPRGIIKEAFAWLKPMGQSRKWFSLWERVDDPKFTTLWSAMEQWSATPVDFPGTAYREYVKKCYFDNALIRGGWYLDGTLVDMKNAKIPAIAIAASEDHIAAPASVLALKDAWGGPTQAVTLKGGHVGISVSKTLPAEILKFLAED